MSRGRKVRNSSLYKAVELLHCLSGEIVNPTVCHNDYWKEQYPRKDDTRVAFYISELENENKY